MPWLNALARDRYEQVPFVTVNGLPLDGHQYGVFRVAKVNVDTHGAQLYLWWRRYDARTLRYAPGEGTWSKVILGAQLTPSWSVE